MKFKEACAKVDADITDWASYLVALANQEKDTTVMTIMHQEVQRSSVGGASPALMKIGFCVLAPLEEHIGLFR